MKYKLYSNKAFDCVDHNKLWKILKEMGVAEHLTCLLRNPCAGQEATELNMEQQTGSKSGKKHVKAVYCHPACLTYTQSTSCKMPGWMKHKLESRLPEEIPRTSDTQMTPLFSFTFIKRPLSSSSLYAIRVVSSVYLKLLVFLLAILIPACASSSLQFCMMYSAYKLNKQDDSIQP